MTVFVKGTTYRYLAPHWFPAQTVGGDEILKLWRKGRDTYDIAVQLGIPEHGVERRLHLMLESDKRDREWNWPPEPPQQRGQP